MKAKVTGGPADSVKFKRESGQMVMFAPGNADTLQLLLTNQSDMDEDNMLA